MQAILDEIGTEESLLSHITKINSDTSQFNTIVIFAAENNAISDADYERIFSQSRIDIIGGIFPQLIFNNQIIKKGFLLVPQIKELKYELIHRLSDPETNLDQKVHDAAKKLNSCESLVIWVDGLSQRISTLLASVYDYFGAHINYYGGGAGRTTGRAKCIFGGKKLYQDCALLIESEFKVYTSVQHGYEIFSGPHIANKSIGNSIHQIDYTDAFHFYSEILKKSNIENLEPKKLINYSVKFPIGIQKYDGTIIVRDPISTNGKNLLCIGDIPEDSVIYILKGDESNIIKAAKDGMTQLIEKSSNLRSFFVVDCINRLHYLNERYYECLKATTAQVEEKKIFGVFSLGEIASDGEHPLEFFSKTIVQCGLELKL